MCVCVSFSTKRVGRIRENLRNNFKAGCADFNYNTNTLVVAACQKDATKETHVIRLFTLAEKAPVDHVKENEKKYIRYFRNHIVSVDYKPRRPGTQDAGEEAQS